MTKFVFFKNIFFSTFLSNFFLGFSSLFRSGFGFIAHWSQKLHDLKCVQNFLSGGAV
jgi:hypothetical protein